MTHIPPPISKSLLTPGHALRSIAAFTEPQPIGCEPVDLTVFYCRSIEMLDSLP